MTSKRKILFTTLPLVIIVAIISTAFFIKLHAESQPKPNVASIQQKSPKLLFNDEFNEAQLDKSKWNTCYDSYSSEFSGCTNHGNFESEWYTSKQVSLNEGSLVLTAQKQQTRGATKDNKEHYYDYSSGMVSTGRYLPESPAKWTASYGYYESRINVPDGKGVWPAFWLLPIDHQWPPEIDIMEILGDKPSQVLTTYHWKGEEGKGVPQDSSTYTSNTSMANSWHIYAVDWKPGVIDWYIDGKQVKHFENSSVTNKQMQIVLNLAVGGTLPGYPDATTPAKSQMLVDYVRVYENS